MKKRTAVALVAAGSMFLGATGESVYLAKQQADRLLEQRSGVTPDQLNPRVLLLAKQAVTACEQAASGGGIPQFKNGGRIATALVTIMGSEQSVYVTVNSSGAVGGPSGQKVPNPKPITSLNVMEVQSDGTLINDTDITKIKDGWRVSSAFPNQKNAGNSIVVNTVTNSGLETTDETALPHRPPKYNFSLSDPNDITGLVNDDLRIATDLIKLAQLSEEGAQLPPPSPVL